MRFAWEWFERLGPRRGLASPVVLARWLHVLDEGPGDLFSIDPLLDTEPRGSHRDRIGPRLDRCVGAARRAGMRRRGLHVEVAHHAGDGLEADPDARHALRGPAIGGVLAFMATAGAAAGVAELVGEHEADAVHAR